MKEKFLKILKEADRRYSDWFLWWPGRKERLFISSGMCRLFDQIIYEREDGDGEEVLSEYEHMIFSGIMRDEAAKYGADFNYKYQGYFWPVGEIPPRRATVRSMIKRIENSYEEEKKIS